MGAAARARRRRSSSGLDGVLGLSVKDLKTGRTLEVRPDEPFPQASSIKLAVLYELYRQAEEGKVDLAEVTRPPLPRVGGGGVLQELGGQVQPHLARPAPSHDGRLVRQRGHEPSSSTAWAWTPSTAGWTTLGLPHTRLRRKMMDLEAARRGEENVAHARRRCGA